LKFYDNNEKGFNLIWQNCKTITDYFVLSGLQKEAEEAVMLHGRKKHLVSDHNLINHILRVLLNSEALNIFAITQKVEKYPIT